MPPPTPTVFNRTLRTMPSTFMCAPEKEGDITFLMCAGSETDLRFSSGATRIPASQVPESWRYICSDQGRGPGLLCSTVDQLAIWK